MDFSEIINEKILLITIIGTLEAVKNKKLSIDEAEKFIFSPHMVKKLKGKKYNEQIINILERGCELENIASLLPHSLEKDINELKESALKLIGDYPEKNKDFWI